MTNDEQVKAVIEAIREGRKYAIDTYATSIIPFIPNRDIIDQLAQAATARAVEVYMKETEQL